MNELSIQPPTTKTTYTVNSLTEVSTDMPFVVFRSDVTSKVYQPLFRENGEFIHNEDTGYKVVKTDIGLIINQDLNREEVAKVEAFIDEYEADENKEADLAMLHMEQLNKNQVYGEL